jgi:hypothetical protein
MSTQTRFSAASYFQSAVSAEGKVSHEQSGSELFRYLVFLDPLFFFLAAPILLFFLSMRYIFFPLSNAVCALAYLWIDQEFE